VDDWLDPALTDPDQVAMPDPVLVPTLRSPVPDKANYSSQDSLDF